ncbi:hypothetical protein [Mycobacterium sp. 852002-40037_SCH5390672]|uniref:hypothetical protein n=1 Tax=Mycobacterium sp. 852002-40037_SCH5390672 TaxID=1834089 RepID=UPI0008057CD4|nr:hypothetical protein [Mycobacterium sp. 852002-40037_SCH5390672]OBB98655.1 hypothetical protein A5782_23985 [Mycobacterium sp. 852002-40037_SCH5390672]
MTHGSTGAPPAPCVVTERPADKQEALPLDADQELFVLIAEVDAILCDAAATLLRRPPAPPVTGCALLGPRSPGRSWKLPAQHWNAPAPDVRAVQRGPPRTNIATNR